MAERKPAATVLSEFFSVPLKLSSRSIEVGNQRFIHHEANDFSGCIKGTGGFPGSGSGVLIVRGKKVLENLPQEFRIKGDFLLKGRILLNGKFVPVKDLDQPGNLFLPPAFVTVYVAKIKFPLFAKEKLIGDAKKILFLLRKIVKPDVGRSFFILIDLIKAVEKTTVHKGNRFKHLQEAFRLLQEVGITVKVCNTPVPIREVLIFFPKAPLFRILIESSKEKVLKKGLIVGSRLR